MTKTIDKDGAAMTPDAAEVERVTAERDALRKALEDAAQHLEMVRRYFTEHSPQAIRADVYGRAANRARALLAATATEGGE